MRTVWRGPASAREEARGIAEALELDRVARGVAHEERPLLAGLAGEAHAGPDEEAYARRLEGPRGGSGACHKLEVTYC